MKKLANLNYSGRELFGEDGVFYYLLSRHNSKAGAQRKMEHGIKSDGPMPARITKQGNRYYLVHRVNKDVQRQIEARLRRGY